MDTKDYTIRLISLKDYDFWINLAREVESLFGPMSNSKEFQEGIKHCIQNKNAFGIEDYNKDLVGIIALDRETNEITWLAVGKEYRGNKYGDKLVGKAIEELERQGDIYVKTFSKKIEQGKSARKIYESNGFIDLKEAGNNPANIETVIMIKKQ